MMAIWGKQDALLALLKLCWFCIGLWLLPERVDSLEQVWVLEPRQTWDHILALLHSSASPGWLAVLVPWCVKWSDGRILELKDKEVEAQRREAPCPRLHSYLAPGSQRQKGLRICVVNQSWGQMRRGRILHWETVEPVDLLSHWAWAQLSQNPTLWRFPLTGVIVISTSESYCQDKITQCKQNKTKKKLPQCVVVVNAQQILKTLIFTFKKGYLCCYWQRKTISIICSWWKPEKFPNALW